MTEPRKCPRCGNIIRGYPALSRRDNKTEICPSCGTAEAVVDLIRAIKEEIPPEQAKLEANMMAYISQHRGEDNGDTAGV